MNSSAIKDSVVLLFVTLIFTNYSDLNDSAGFEYATFKDVFEHGFRF